MKLHARPASPFARKVRVAIIEMGLVERVEIAMAQSPEESRAALGPHNPLAKVPTLVLDDGTSLYDSRVIVEYLDSLHDRAKLFPRAGAERWRVLKLQALGDGIGDAAALMGGEMGRSDAQRSQGALDRHWDKIQAATGVLEDKMALLDGPPNIGQIAVACGLGYCDFRLTGHAWRDGRPKLAQWIAAFNERPSMQATFFARPNR